MVGEIRRCCTGPSYWGMHIAYVIQVLEKRTRVQFVCESARGGVDADDNLVVVAGRGKETG